MPLTQLVSAIALSVVIGIALSQSQSSGQSITVGGFVAFIGAMLMLIAPMRRLSDVIDPITRSLAALERGLDLLDSVLFEAAPATWKLGSGMAQSVLGAMREMPRFASRTDGVRIVSVPADSYYRNGYDDMRNRVPSIERL